MSSWTEDGPVISPTAFAHRYQLASVFAGGPAPLVATWLYARFQSAYAIAG
jgi:hypothetical protein